MQKIQNESNLDASLHIKFQIASMYPSKIHHLSHVITNIKYKIFPKALLIISYKGNVHKKKTYPSESKWFTMSSPINFSK